MLPLILGGLAAQGLGGLLGAAGEPKMDVGRAAEGAFSNRFGETGAAAKDRASNAFSNLGNTASARLAAINQNNLAGSLLGSVQGNADTGARLATRQWGNMRRSALDSGYGGGSSPAALAGMIARLKEMQDDSLGSLNASNMAGALNAAGGASSMYASGQNILQNDFGNQLNKAGMQLADFNPALFGANLDAQEQLSPWQGLLQGLSGAFGQLGAGATGAGVALGTNAVAHQLYGKQSGAKTAATSGGDPNARMQEEPSLLSTFLGL